MVVILRKVYKESLEKIMNWRMLPEVTKFMYTDPKLTLEDQHRWYAQISNDSRVRYWLIEVDGTEIGLISLTDIDRTNQRACWAYYIANTSFRGKGLGRILECNMYDFVFDVLKLNKLWCEVFTFNEDVIKIHQKFGSEIEGVLKQHIYKNGLFFDIVRMGITREKWQNIKNNYQYEKIKIE